MSTAVTDWVAYNARRIPDAIALEGLDSGTTLTWSGLEARVARMAGALRDRFGVRPGDRVAIIAEDDPRVIELQFACIRIQAIFVPLNWRLARPELEVLCRDSEPTLMVHDDVWQEAATALRDSVNMPEIVSWGCADTPADLDTEVERAAPVPEYRDHDAAQITQILYTSGTTGTPKGAMISFGSMVANAVNVAPGLRTAEAGSRYLSVLPLFHAAGLNTVANPILMTGGSMSIMRRFDPERTAALLQLPGYTHFNSAPAMYQMLIPHVKNRFSEFRGVMCGGSKLEPDLSEQFAALGMDLQGAWGATEMGPCSTLMPRRERGRKADTVGFPVQHAQLRVMDFDTGEEVPQGEPGEGWIRGPAIFSGYWRRGDEGQGAPGWFKSGDAISFDEEGYVRIHGRFKDMYKSGGENVFAVEVERVLLEHPDVLEAAVIGVPDERWGEVGRAYLVTREGASVSIDELTAYCAPLLAKYKIPKSIKEIDTMPRNVLGKLQKNLLD